MKKLVSFALLLFSLCMVLPSCSSDDDDNTGGGSTTTFDDWNDPKSPNYKPNGYNPIEGNWLMKNGSYTVVFSDSFEFRETHYSAGELEDPSKLLSTYKINNTTFKTDKKIPYSQDKIDTFPYKLGKDDQGDYIDITYPLGTVRYYKLN
ncbi:MAG: hypothetical protein E6772_07460 [Dysgonomonas sp.]|nr:hypothetical protein [Dysgonomonas sp.]